MTDIIAIGIVLIILGIATTYIIKAKKSGVKCIGCPDAKTCQSRSADCSGCCGNCSGCSPNRDIE